METEKLKLERKFFNEKAPAEMMREFVKKPEFYLNRGYNGSDEGYVQRCPPAGYGM